MHVEYLKGKKERAIWKVVASSENTAKKISEKSHTSLAHTYRTIKEMKKEGDVLQTWKRPMMIAGIHLYK